MSSTGNAGRRTACRTSMGTLISGSGLRFRGAGCALFAIVSLLAPGPAAASGDVIRIGVLNDQSGPYAGVTGKGSVEAAKMAVEELEGTVAGRKVEVVFADHQNKPDIGAAIARHWYDEDGVDLIVDVVTSSVALAVQEVARDRKKIVIFSGAGSDELTGRSCSPNGFVWSWDTYALSHSAGQSILKEGGRSWYLIAVNYALGLAFENDLRSTLDAGGGTVVGVARHPLGTRDFSSYLLSAQASQSQVVAFLNGGADAQSAVKQAVEFGLLRTGGPRVVTMGLFLDDVHTLGTEVAQGLRITESFYWDRDDASRAWSRRFADRMGGQMPSLIQAGTYSAVRHYLRAVAEAGTTGASAVLPAMRRLPVQDPTMSDGARIREDGRLMRDFYLFEVKAPSASKGPWDLYRLIRTIPAEEAALPLGRSACPLIAGR